MAELKKRRPSAALGRPSEDSTREERDVEQTRRQDAKEEHLLRERKCPCMWRKKRAKKERRGRKYAQES